MKRYISYSILVTFLIHLLPAFHINTAKASDCFIVTAYYSPLPNQNYYFKWSYEDDITLNWKWTHWASWKAVFSWMLAAPSKYAFWTKIYLDWVWIWEVADRWWAIVKAWERWYEYDRIDIWMWAWEEWLARALTWWKRTVCNSYVTENSSDAVTLDINNFPAPKSALAWLKKAKIDVLTREVSPSSTIDEIKALQEYLKGIWYYNWSIDWEYSKETALAVYNFQFANKIVNSPKNNWAWIWWPQTKNIALELKLKQDEIEKQKAIASKTENLNQNTTNIPDIFSTNVWEESSTENIKKVQQIFKDLWLYTWEINWKYSDIKNILIDYQLKTWVIDSKTNIWAWYFGPKTRAQTKTDYLVYLEKKKAEDEKNQKIQAELAVVKETVTKKVTTHMESIWSPKEWDIWKNVRVLQQTLNMLWYFKTKDTAIFGKTTKESLINYQIAKWLVKTKTDSWAWVFWPKTKESMKNDLFTLLETKALEEKNLLVYKK